MKKIGFIGCGNMGSAIAKAISKTEGFELFLADYDNNKAEALADEIKATAADNAFVFSKCDYIFLAVKPNVIKSVLEDAKEYLSLRTDTPVLISIAAGVSINQIKEIYDKCPIIRVMPNTPVSVGEGMVLYCNCGASYYIDEFKQFMQYSGLLYEIPEKLIDAASAVSGCGPAFAYMFCEALADGGVAAGLPRDMAMLFAAQMLKGSAEMLLKSGEHPGRLKDNVCSPGGSTIEGVLTLEEGSFRGAVSDAVLSAYYKTMELGK